MITFSFCFLLQWFNTNSNSVCSAIFQVERIKLKTKWMKSSFCLHVFQPVEGTRDWPSLTCFQFAFSLMVHRGEWNLPSVFLCLCVCVGVCVEASCLTLERLQTGRTWAAALRNASRLTTVRHRGYRGCELDSCGHLSYWHTHTHQINTHTHSHACSTKGWRRASGLSHVSSFYCVATKQRRDGDKAPKERKEAATKWEERTITCGKMQSDHTLTWSIRHFI